MADNFLNNTGLSYYHNRIKTIFPSKTEFDALEDKVDEIIAEGGEPNVIETVKVNGTALTPDAQKAVDVTVPTATSDLTNDGDGDSPFATEEYVAENGGKIDVIQVNGTPQTITSKTVNIAVPTNNNQLTNGAGYQTATDVDGLIDTALANGNDPYTTTSDAQGLIDDALADITGVDFQVVATLPASGVKGTIYLVGTASPYDEYVWIEPTGGTAFWEKIGSTDIDLTDYWTSQSGQTNSLIAITTAQIDALFA